MTNIDIRHGDCLAVLRELPDNSVDSIVTDPPYGLSNTKPSQVADVLAAWVTGDTEVVPAKKGGFMGKDWDSFVPPPAVWEECLRVLKPGGHMAVFAGARTQDLMGLSIRLAGFEIRDSLGWVYGSGFPKSMDVSKAIDKAAGAEREVISERPAYGIGGNGILNGHSEGATAKVTAPATDDAKQWDGWGTALKPAIEPIILARKPLDGTVAQNVLEHGVGGLNIDACRIEFRDDVNLESKQRQQAKSTDAVGGGFGAGGLTGTEISTYKASGRFPANVLLDEHAAREMDRQSDNSSRFFPVFKYQAKAQKKERPVVEREDGTKIQHPTVKPAALMEWLVALISPPGGTVLDPFAGTGTTLQAARDKGFNSIGIEQDADYIRLIEARLSKN